MDRSLIRAFAHKPFLIDELEVLEVELNDIEQGEEALYFHPSKQCVTHRFSHDWDMEYVVLQHWSDNIGASFSMTEDTDKQGFYNAYIKLA